MPIESLIPTIDNRRFDDIVAEARTRIPRYTPEWTDLNDNDPGITLVQLFAWMCDLLLYRLGKVPDLNYLKFLQLVGIELLPAESAQAEITFPMQPAATVPFVTIPPQTAVVASAPGEERPVVFETERGLVALAARLAAVRVLDGFSILDVTAANDEAKVGFNPIGAAANADNALMLGFDFNGLFPEVELNLAVFAVQKIGPATAVDCGLPPTPSFTSSKISWEYWSGSEWRTLKLLKDETRALVRSGHIYFKTPHAGQMAKMAIGGQPGNFYWIRGRLLRADYDQAPALLAIRTNTVEARQAETARDEVLGGSRGEPNQTFQLANHPVLANTLRVEVDEGDGLQPWQEVPDFFGSTKDDRHYVLNRTTGEVRFGNGTRGAIPVANVQNAGANVVARVYRFGGGKRGNVGANTLKTPQISVPGIAEDQIGNLLPAIAGRDEETLDEAKERAPATLKSNCRAVTAEDFEELAKRAGDVKRAKALPLFHPGFPGIKVPGVVTVIVVPDNEQPNPMPSEGTVRTVCAYLNQRRLLTTELYVIPPEYQEVTIRASIVASNQADLGEVKQAVEDALTTYFHPLRGGEDRLGWPFGGDIFFSRVYQQVLAVPGVQRIEQLLIVVDGEAAPECRDVSVPAATLLFSTSHDIQVNYAFEE